MFAIFENLWWDYWLREAEKGVQNTKTTRKKGNVTWTCFPHIPQRFPPPRQSWASTLPWWRLHLLLRDILQMTEKLISFLRKFCPSKRIFQKQAQQTNKLLSFAKKWLSFAKNLLSFAKRLPNKLLRVPLLGLFVSYEEKLAQRLPTGIQENV